MLRSPPLPSFEIGERSILFRLAASFGTDLNLVLATATVLFQPVIHADQPAALRGWSVQRSFDGIKEFRHPGPLPTLRIGKFIVGSIIHGISPPVSWPRVTQGLALG